MPPLEPILEPPLEPEAEGDATDGESLGEGNMRRGSGTRSRPEVGEAAGEVATPELLPPLPEAELPGLPALPEPELVMTAPDEAPPPERRW